MTRLLDSLKLSLSGKHRVCLWQRDRQYLNHLSWNYIFEFKFPTVTWAFISLIRYAFENNNCIFCINLENHHRKDPCNVFLYAVAFGVIACTIVKCPTNIKLFTGHLFAGHCPWFTLTGHFVQSDQTSFVQHFQNTYSVSWNYMCDQTNQFWYCRSPSEMKQIFLF